MHSADATVSLQMPSSVSEEAGSVDICADLTAVPPGGLECDIVLTLSLTDGTKAGKLSVTQIKFYYLLK